MPKKNTDELEARHMEGGAAVVHRDKKVSRGLAALVAVPGFLTIVLAAYLAFANATASKPVPADALPFVVGAIATLGVALVVMGVMFGVVRTVVTQHEVNVKFGLWGPRISLASIRSVKVVDYDWTKFGGWGIRRAMDGTWAYVPGGKRVLEIRFVEDAKERCVLVGCENPDETARQIERAREPVRVAVDSGAAEEEAPAHAAEAEKKQAV